MLRIGLRLVWVYVRRAPWEFTLAVTGAALYGVMLVVGAWLIGRATDVALVPEFTDGEQRGAMGWILAGILGVALLRSIGVILRRYFGSLTTERNNRVLRNRLADIYLERSLAQLRARPTGELLAHADTDVEVSTFLLQPLPFTVGLVFLMSAAMLSLALIDPWMLAVALLVFPATWFANRVFTQKVMAPAEEVREQVGAVSTVVHESIDGALVVKTLGREAAEVERLRVPADALRRARLRIGVLRGTFEPALDTLPNLGIVVLLAVGGWRVSAGGATTGQVVQAMALFQQLALPMRIVGFFLEETAQSVVAARRLDRVFTLPVAGRFGGDRELPAGSLGVEFDDVAFAHGDEPVLDGCSFRVDPGEVVALVGSTGAGKTTIAQLLFGLEVPSAGTIWLGGMALDAVDPDELRARASLVSQETFLFAESVRDNVALGREVGDAEVRRHAATARAEFVESLPRGWDTVVGERGVTLSGGQRQRVALTRALIGQPGLIFLDDSTSAVDPTIERQILDRLAADLETTVIVVAHRLSTIELADRVLFLQRGRIDASGSHDELLHRDDYRRLVTAYGEGGR